MTEKTVRELPETSGVVGADIMFVQKDGSGLPSWARIGNALMGAGLSAASYLTLGTVQTVTALKTFAAGIKLGASAGTLDYFNYTTWTPEIWDAATSGTKAVGTTAAQGWYTRIGPRVFGEFNIITIDTTGLTGANAVFIRGLPFAIKNSALYRARGVPVLSDCTYTGAPVLSGPPNTTYLNIFLNDGVGGPGTLIVSDISSGTGAISGNFMYEVG